MYRFQYKILRKINVPLYLRTSEDVQKLIRVKRKYIFSHLYVCDYFFVLSSLTERHNYSYISFSESLQFCNEFITPTSYTRFIDILKFHNVFYETVLSIHACIISTRIINNSSECVVQMQASLCTLSRISPVELCFVLISNTFAL